MPPRPPMHPRTRHPSVLFLSGQTRSDGIKQDMYLVQIPRGTHRYRRIAFTEEEARIVLAQLVGLLRKNMRN